MKALPMMVVALSALVALWGQSVPARAADCNGNGIPDDMDPDCNANGLPDACDISGKLYWSDSGTERISRANFNGSRIENLVTTGLTTARNVAVDGLNGWIFWTDAGTDKVQRANLDGTGVQDLVATGLISPQGIAVDPVGGKIYWADSGTDKIQRANLDGTGLQDLVTTGLSTPQGIALDLVGGKMYFTDFAFSHIQRANLDGTSVQHVVTTGANPYGIALDPGGGKVYWTEQTSPRVRRANLDGTSIQSIVTSILISPTGVAVDPAAGKVYWADFGTDLIQRANLDGTQVEDVILSGLVDPQGLTIAFPIADADQNGIPDECEGTPSLVSAASGKPNAMGPDGFCDLPIELARGGLITSEPRDGGITEVIFTYDGPVVAGSVDVESDCTCPSPPTYAPIIVSVTCTPNGDALVCTFDPGLPNACTYRFTVSSAAGTASVELRGLRGDVDSSGRTNASDRSAVVSVWTGANFSCETDMDSSGRTNGADRSSIVSSWTGGQNCAP